VVRFTGQNGRLFVVADVARLLPRLWDGQRALRFLAGLAMLALAFAAHAGLIPSVSAPITGSSSPVVASGLSSALPAAAETSAESSAPGGSSGVTAPGGSSGVTVARGGAAGAGAVGGAAGAGAVGGATVAVGAGTAGVVHGIAAPGAGTVVLAGLLVVVATGGLGAGRLGWRAAVPRGPPLG
jgi:hypothetical protein